MKKKIIRRHSNAYFGSQEMLGDKNRTVKRAKNKKPQWH